MADFSKEEMLKLAKLSALSVSDNEIEMFTGNLKKVLNFVDQIREVEVSGFAEQIKNKNILREDEVIPTESSDILNLSSNRQECYFVVPKILDEK